MPPLFDIGLVWFRRDLRLQDNAALALALRQCRQVHCVFVFDTAILAPLPRDDRRVAFIHDSLSALDAGLQEWSGRPGTGMIVLHGAPEQEIPAIASTLNAEAVFCARDYEPSAKRRDALIAITLAERGQQLVTVKDHVIFEDREILTQAGAPYSVFTPYLRAWLARLEATDAAKLQPLPGTGAALQPRPAPWAGAAPTLADIGFNRIQAETASLPSPLSAGMQTAENLLQDFYYRIDHYHERRDFPALKGPSYLSVHLRFGTISIRALVRLALQAKAGGSAGASTWLSELAWRDFYFQILSNFPHVATAAFRPEYDAIAWESGPEAERRFKAWCEGQTGYPLVDAAMLQLRQSGYMHNRLRMVAGSFLVKHLGIDWRRGESYFAAQLNDFDLSANNGGWQWVSSSGCDAQPYFRIFNPIRQSERFDPQGKFIRRYLPALAPLSDKAIHAPWLAKPIELSVAGITLGQQYPLPVVDHSAARAETLARYARARQPTATTQPE